jgi:UDP-N-acetyl-D-galactosamine dehydrogenase
MLNNGIDVARSNVGVLGITFKENCPDIRNSKIVDLVNELKKWNVKPVIYDPWANAEEVRHEYGLEVGSLDDLQGVDALVVAVGHQQFRQMTPEELRALCRGDKPVLADVKAIYDRDIASDAGFTVFRL